MGSAGVGTTSLNRGCSADAPYTAVPAPLPVTIWGLPVEMLLNNHASHNTKPTVRIYMVSPCIVRLGMASLYETTCYTQILTHTANDRWDRKQVDKT
jgi:hypothetical protein